jgi:amidophosphoribosyltransferase
MPTKKEFVANGLKADDIAKVIGADKLFYQDIKDLLDSAKAGNPKISNFCYACMSGRYPTSEVTQELLQKAEMSRGDVHEIEQEADGDEMKDDQLTLL